MFRIKTGRDQRRGKLVSGEDGLHGRKFLLYRELLGWSRSDDRTSGALRREDEEVVLDLPDSSPSYSDLGICVCLGPVFFLQQSKSPGCQSRLCSAQHSPLLCASGKSYSRASAHPHQPLFQTQLILMLPTYSPILPPTGIVFAYQFNATKCFS